MIVTTKDTMRESVAARVADEMYQGALPYADSGLTVTVETPYGKIKHKKDICLAKRVEIEWDTKIDENGAPTIHIKNRKEAHAKMQTAILEMVLSGEERLEVPLDEFSQTIQGRCCWFDEKAQPLPTWFAKKPSISKVIYAFDFSTQQAHFSTPYFTFFKDDVLRGTHR